MYAEAFPLIGSTLHVLSVIAGLTRMHLLRKRLGNEWDDEQV